MGWLQIVGGVVIATGIVIARPRQVRPSVAQRGLSWRDDRTIFVDFDGTITDHDLLDRIAQTFGDPEVYREVDERLDERAIDAARRPAPGVRARHGPARGGRRLGPRARDRSGRGSPSSSALPTERGWRLVVLSSGFRELIEPVLEREGLAELELLVELRPARSGRLAGAVPGRAPSARSAASRASGRQFWPRRTAARRSTSATGSRIAAVPRPPISCSRGGGSPST